MSFFNMKIWRVKFRNFLGDFPDHYAAIFVNRTINSNCMTLLMTLHHIHDRFWYFFRCYKSNTHFWNTSNFQSSKKAILHWGSCVFPDVILVSNYHSYKEKTKLPNHSFYGGHIPQRKFEPPFLAVCLKKYKATRIPT